jgi:transposase-like protein
MAKAAPTLNARKRAVEAVYRGVTITEVARDEGITRATLYAWLKAFDPERPLASLRPQRRGPKGPRWGNDVVNAVIELIAGYPPWVGSRHLTRALAKRGIVVPERTVSRILPVARERLAIERDRAQRKSETRRSREVAAMTRHDERDARREAEAAQWFEQNITPGITPEEAIRRISEALSKTAWKIRTKDLTPTCANSPTPIAGRSATTPTCPPRTIGCAIPGAGKITIPPVSLRSITG